MDKKIATAALLPSYNDNEENLKAVIAGAERSVAILFTAEYFTG